MSPNTIKPENAAKMTAMMIDCQWLSGILSKLALNMTTNTKIGKIRSKLFITYDRASS